MMLGDTFETFRCFFEITTKHTTQRRELEAPRFVLEHQFVALMEQAASADEAVKVSIRRMIPIWSQFDQKWIEREAFIEFKNRAYVAAHGSDD